MEQHIPKTVQKNITKDVSTWLYNESEQLYLETDVSSAGLAAGLIQARDGMWLPKDKTPDDSALWPIVFASKSLTSAKTHFGKTERKALGILYGLEKFHQYCFTMSD